MAIRKTNEPIHGHPSQSACTIPYPGVDKVKVKVNVEVKVNIRRRLGEVTARQGVANGQGIAKRKRRQDKTSPRAGITKVGRRQGEMSQERGIHSVAPRYPWVGKTMEGVTLWEGLKPRQPGEAIREEKGGFKAIVLAPVESNLTREVPMTPQRGPWDRYDS